MLSIERRSNSVRTSHGSRGFGNAQFKFSAINMRLVNESSVEVVHFVSPKATYEVFRKHMSLALGGIKNIGDWGGGHPFDIELARIPPGKKGYPYHSHAAQTEYYAILNGSGMIIDGAGTSIDIKAGDHFI